jgi:uncharacterized protein with LGFP repeats
VDPQELRAAVEAARVLGDVEPLARALRQAFSSPEALAATFATEQAAAPAQQRALARQPASSEERPAPAWPAEVQRCMGRAAAVRARPGSRPWLEPGLPPGWVQHTAPDGRLMYHPIHRGGSTWEPESAAAPALNPAAVRLPTPSALPRHLPMLKMMTWPFADFPLLSGFAH